jgi:hypothetical protein
MEEYSWPQGHHETLSASRRAQDGQRFIVSGLTAEFSGERSESAGTTC